MANSSDKWYFTKEQLDNTPSRKCGYDSFKELSYRQQTANFIQDMGQRLKVSQLCINTAIVYMHRFYVFHSFTHFPWHQMAAAALFLAAKVEEQPRKLEYVIRVANICRNNRDNLDVNSERYQAQSQDLVFNENVLLQTLGFDVAIDHPHTHVVRCCHLVRASKDLSQSSYFLASNSLHLTTMCLQYRPTVVACFCIHLACKWSRWEIPLSTEKKEWFLYVDPTVTSELLQQLTAEFFSIFESCPSRLKEKIMSIGDNGMHNTSSSSVSNSPFDTDPKKMPPEQKDAHAPHRSHDTKSTTGSDDPHKHRSSSSSSSSQQQREREYREKKEREKLAAQQQQQQGMKQLVPPPPKQSSSHHRPPMVDAKMKQQQQQHHHHSSSGVLNRNSSSSSSNHPASRSGPPEPRDILREAARESPFGLATTKDYNVQQQQHNSSKSNSDKDVQNKRDYLLKPNEAAMAAATTTTTNSYGNYNGDNNNKQTNRPQQSMPLSNRSIDPNNKVPLKHEQQVRRHDNDKMFNHKSDLNSNSSENKRQQQPNSVAGHDRNNTSSSSSSSSLNSGYLNKSLNSTSQTQNNKHLYNTTATTDKSVLKSGTALPMNKHHHNGNNYQQQQIKEEIPNIKDEHQHVMITKRPSLFSPEKSPTKPIQQQQLLSSPTPPQPQSNRNDMLSPLQSPPPNQQQQAKRVRNYSTGSEPELRPVMKKIDQVEGFENLMRDSSIGINKLHQVPDIITPITDVNNKSSYNLNESPLLTSYSKEMKPPDIIPPLCSDNNMISATTAQQQPIINGIETNPVLISSLLKETPPTVSHLPVGGGVVQPKPDKDSHHHHHKSKKKNKEKHKHKDKDKEKKKKHKDKDREKHKHSIGSSSSSKHEDFEQQQQTTTITTMPVTTEPIKIKIQKDKIQLPTPNNPLKIKISKDVIKTESVSGGGGDAPPLGLKIKIPRDKINNCEVEKSRKRDRSSPGDGPPGKMSKSNSSSSSSSSHKESKQNGRHSYNNKVTQLGDGDTSIHRLAESKYINKNTSS